MLEENLTTVQNVIIENRKRLNISGVKDVPSFDDETIALDTALGKMTVKGEGLQIESFNNQTGDLVATGKLYAVVYLSDTKSSGGLLSRLFK